MPEVQFVDGPEDRFATLEEVLAASDDREDSASVPPSRGAGPTDEERRRNAVRRLSHAGVERDEIEREIAYRVRRCRDLEVSWADIGAALGVSKQSVQRRFS